MATDWDNLHSIFLGNITSGMYTWLANHLGVSVEALQGLQIGYTPRVLFGGKGLKKEYISYDGWFTCPMRDDSAKIIGINLRNCVDKKVMYPGSKPGCMFIVNPQHRQGENGYSKGAHNWTRVADAQTPCPICGKMDGCAVSAEDPSDPKAVICIRQTSPHKCGIGWLHIRKETGKLANASALPGGEADTPCVVVEGWSDVAAAFDLGFVGVGKPNNIGGQDTVAQLVRGRTVIIMGENDKKPNGDWPGMLGASMSLKAILQTTAKARILFPPDHIKDLRVWKTNFGLTSEILLADAQDKGQEHVTEDLIPDDRPLTIFRAFLKDVYQVGKVTLLKYWEKGWYVYTDSKGRYAATEEDSLIASFTRWTDPKKVIVETAKGEKPINLKYTKGMWSTMRDVALADGYLEGPLPQWINGKNGLEMKDMICFTNGILDVDAFLDGDEGYLLPSTPDLFTINALPFEFDPTAICPRWLAFIDSSLGDDPAKIALLQEWIGYCMTTDNSFEKMMYMRGPTRVGKGTILKMIGHLVGKDQIASPRFKKLAGQFGLQSLRGKMVCLIGDARDDKGGATLLESLEVLLSIVSGDALQVDRKNLTQIEGESLTCRITIASNTFLNLPDTAGAMESRLLLLDFQRPVLKLDETLKDTLPEEVQGIAVWALDGLRRLRKNRKFTEPASSIEALQEWKKTNNPLHSFLEECTTQDQKGIVPQNMLFDCWEKWAFTKRFNVGTKSQFFNDLTTLATYATRGSVQAGDRNEIVYKGFKLTNDAQRRYLGRPL